MTQPSFSARVNHCLAPAGGDEDAQLMVRLSEGDHECFPVLLSRYRTTVVRFLQRMVGDGGVAEELAQEVFLRVYRARSTYQPAAKFSTWLFRIATRLALNSIRDTRKERFQASTEPGAAVSEVPDRNRTVEEELIYQVGLEEVRQAIDSLPGKQRAAVLLHKYEEMEYSAIARVLGCSDAAVKSLLFRAYENLRSRLAHRR